MSADRSNPPAQLARGRGARALDTIERIGNRLPDPIALFLWLLLIVAIVSAFLAARPFSAIDPRTGQMLQITNLLSPTEIVRWLSRLVTTFMEFNPVGVVIVAMLGIGVADHTGLLRAGLRALLSRTSARILTPLVIVAGLLSHTAADAGYVLVIPLAAAIFHSAGRHPLAGLAAGFLGVSGGFCANLLPGPVDVVLQALSQEAAHLIDDSVRLNVLNNLFFTMSSGILITALGWVMTDRMIEPRLNRTTSVVGGVDASASEQLAPAERRGLFVAGLLTLILIAAVAATMLPARSVWRSPGGQLTSSDAPLMQAVVPLIFLFFLTPAAIYGYIAGTVRSHRDLIKGMQTAVSGLAYYVVLAFFAAQFIAAFARSNLGTLLAVTGAQWLQSASMPHSLMLVCLIAMTSMINFAIGSAVAKWTLLAPIFVPMLMQAGLSPDLTQAAYRIGDSSTNIVSPLMPYFPLIVVYCQKYVPRAGLGTILALMFPYAIALLVCWTTFLILYWHAGLPLGVQSSYLYGAP